MSLGIRHIGNNYAEVCGKIGYETHKGISFAHSYYTSEPPSEEFGIGLIKSLFGNPNPLGVLAEQQDRIFGSIFLHIFPPSPVTAIALFSVHHSAEGNGACRKLIDAALSQARIQNHEQVRLVQSTTHIRSFVLYT